jgi:hypothetical protein
MQSKKARLVEQVAVMRIMRNVYNILVVKPKEIDKLGAIDVDDKVTAICVLLKCC